MKRKSLLLSSFGVGRCLLILLHLTRTLSDHDTLLGINEYTNVDAFTIQDIIKIDARHAFVPFIARERISWFQLLGLGYL